MHSQSATSPEVQAATRTLLGITQNNGATGEFLRLSEMHDGTFILLAQNNVGAGSFTFSKDAPDEVRLALRALQEAMRRSNLDGVGGGVNNATLGIGR